MLLLQRLQIGRRFCRVVSPPLLSGILCPASQSNTVMMLVHQLTRHLPSNFLPICCNHTCSRNALGIFCLTVFDAVDATFVTTFAAAFDDILTGLCVLRETNVVLRRVCFRGFFPIFLIVPHTQFKSDLNTICT